MSPRCLTILLFLYGAITAHMHAHEMDKTDQNGESKVECERLSRSHPCFNISGQFYSEDAFDSFSEADFWKESIIRNTTQTAFSIIDSATSTGDPYCAVALRHIVCLTAAPPCDLDLLPVCTNSCLVYSRLLEEGNCDSFFHYYKGLISSGGITNEHGLQTLMNVTFEFNCSNASSYYAMNNVDAYLDSDNCTEFFTQQQTEIILEDLNQMRTQSATTQSIFISNASDPEVTSENQNQTQSQSVTPQSISISNATGTSAESDTENELQEDTSDEEHPDKLGVVVGATVAAVGLIILVVILVLGLTVWKRVKSHHLELTVTGYKPTLTLQQKGDAACDFQLNTLTIFNHKQEFERVSNLEVFSSILVHYSTLTVGVEVGHGAFGKVYRGSVKRQGDKTSMDVAIKTIKNLNSKEEREAFLAESLIMKNFQHPNILGLTGVCFDTPDGVPFIILPFMANGSLKDYLKRKRTDVTNVDTLPEDLSISLLVRMCMDIANGMEYLADEKFVHRDLAARNCMVDAFLVVKIGDFGLARDVYCGNYCRANAAARLPVKWMAPETLHDAISNEKTDVWSFGVTCWEVFSLGRSPYPGLNIQDILNSFHNNERLKQPSLCSEKLYDLTMSQCWKLLPEERPTFSQLAHQLQEYWEEEHAYVVEDINESPSSFHRLIL